MKLLRTLLTVFAWLYLGGLVVYVAALRLVGESFWLTTVLLYVPQVLLLVPGGLIALSLLVAGPRRLALVPVAGGLVLLFGLVGPRLGLGVSPGPGPHLRILTYNTNSGEGPIPEIVAQIREAAPDIVVLQESSHEVNVTVAAALPGYATHESTQFFLATRFTLLEAREPPMLTVEGREHHPRFMRYVVDTPLGPLDLFSVHPVSPRPALEDVRGVGLRYELESGRIATADRHVIIANTALRRAQLQAILDETRAATHPVLIAGDTNLPHGSSLLATYLGGFQDAFDEAGRGLGFTFPANRKLAWMRIDRIFAGAALRFTSATVGRRHGSDHYCLWADVERR